MKSIKKNAWFFCWPAMGTRRPAAPQRQCTVWRMRQQKQNTTGKAAVLYSTTGRREPPPFMPSCYAHRLLFSSVPAHSSTGPLVPSFPRNARAKIAFFMVSIWARTASAASLACCSLSSKPMIQFTISLCSDREAIGISNSIKVFVLMLSTVVPFFIQVPSILFSAFLHTQKKYSKSKSLTGETAFKS